MADAAGFSNSWTEGEICDDAWDRVDIQPVGKGCQSAINLVIRVAGPLGKRRGFWDLGAVDDETKLGRMVPFRRSVTDALMLEFGNEIVRVWQANGSPLLDMGVQVSFASPYTDAQTQLLRWKQVADVIYIRTSDGQPPQALERLSDTSWAFNVESFPNGPWMAENVDTTSTITVSGTDFPDGNVVAGGGMIMPGEVVSLVATDAIFDPAQVGGCFRTRAGDGTASVLAWSPGFKYFQNDFAISVGHVYAAANAGSGGFNAGSNPPVQLSGNQSDGAIVWQYLHDGAGVIQITAVADAMNATGTVLAGHPLKSGQATSFWSEGAYSNYRGWPRAWPALREERLCGGATANNLDFLDLTETSGFYPDHENFHPGTGLDLVLDTDAIRRRLGDDNGEIIWTLTTNYLLAGTISGEYLVAGSVLDEPLSPSAITLKNLSDFGSADVYPAKAWKGLCYVTRGAQTVRELVVDTQQGFTTQDLTVLANHIGGVTEAGVPARSFAQLTWIPTPDEVLWTRLGDGGLAAMTYHQEQQVKGWSRQQLPGGIIEPGAAVGVNGYIVEDMQSLPGPGEYETLWLIVSRVKDGVTQRHLWMQSQQSDALFLDGAQLYTGAPATVFGGLMAYAGETVWALADGAQVEDLAVSGAGEVTLETAAAKVQIGFLQTVQFESLKLSTGFIDNTLNTRQRIAGAIVSFKGVEPAIGLSDGDPELVSTRTRSEIAFTSPKRWIHEVTLAGDGEHDGRDPRIVITERSVYDFVLYSIKPKIAPGG